MVMNKALSLLILTVGLTLSIFLLAGGGTHASQSAGSPPTFSKEVVRIFQNNCQNCHNPIGVAPFSLLTYSDALKYTEAIKFDVINYKMPQSQVRIDNGCTGPDTFAGQRRLTQAEIDTIVRWVEAGAPEGDPAALPPPRTFTSGKEWLAGEPDLVLMNASNGFTVPPGVQRDIFRNFPIPTNFEEDRYIVGIEVRPGIDVTGGKSLVHHVLIQLDPTGQSLAEEKKFQDSKPAIPGPGYESITGVGFPSALLGSWFPGSDPLALPEGVGIKIPKGAYIVMQVHYGGETQSLDHSMTDTTFLGIKFARKPIIKERETFLCRNESFKIPAGDQRFTVIANTVVSSAGGAIMEAFPEAVTIDSVTPHQHRLGTDFKAEAILPDGKTQCLVDVDWDVTHQGTYFYNRPVQLPAGTKIKVTALYDNSDNNPNQLNLPAQDIPWGRSANLEMCQLTLGLTRDKQILTPSSPSIVKAAIVNEKLVVTGEDLRSGAFIEIDGKLLQDTKVKSNKKGKLQVSSLKEWRKALPKSGSAGVVVINPDGGRSGAISFDRGE
jgi:hypothetical protein